MINFDSNSSNRKKRYSSILNSLLYLGLFLFFACDHQPTRFTLLKPEKTGVHFSNTIYESDSIHYFNFPYIYAGAGLGVADFNNDNLPDIFFAGNMVTSRLYINKGDFKFEDQTQSAGVGTKQWVTGVSVVDINQDGWMDIYLCVAGFTNAENRKNLLFINNGDLTFTESAQAYGIDDDGHSTQAAFFDYDLDGDLDLYLMQHANESYIQISKLKTLQDGTGPSTDRLYQNLGKEERLNFQYQDVSGEAGILIEGYGLGLAISDINQDNWPDIYVANDFIGSDLLYINNQDGTFSNQIDLYLNQISRNGMGVDIADINNDALPDILVMDMLPPDNYRQKTMTSQMNYEHFKNTRRQGFSPQFIRNTLQLNRGESPNGQYLFSEVGRLAGLHQTDWSWAPLIADFDLDGWKDVYITNGFRRDVTDHDFQEYTVQTNAFVKGSGKMSIPEVTNKLHQLDSVYLHNFAYQNKGSLNFEDKSKEWGFETPSMSNGAAYADFDNDGDLDLVVNNINAPAFLYKNNTDPTNHAHYLGFKLTGKYPNLEAIGSKVMATLPNGQKHYQEIQPVRGYMSSFAQPNSIGLGNHKKLDSLVVTWPGGTRTHYTDLIADTIYHFILEDSQAHSLESNEEQKPSNPMFVEVSKELNIQHEIKENVNNDFRYQPLLLQQYDNNGPGIAVGDINADGREDFYIGGARNYPGTLFIQSEDGTFNSKQLEGSEFYEDMGALFLDIDQDQDLDLYVVSGGSSVKYFDKGHYQDRLYINDGNGNFDYREDLLPRIESSGSCVAASDYDQDGDLDLFIGGRVLPGKFPLTPRSYLLENRNGRFFDRTEEIAIGLGDIGMVCTALWTDYDNDLDLDLLVTGEWMPITIFSNNNGRLELFSGANGLEDTKGLWNSLVGADFDKDGDIDFVAGNLGRNTALSTNPGQPLRLYAKDFDGNSTIDPIFTRFIDGKEYPIAPRAALIDQLERINRAFPSYREFAAADIHQILGIFDQDQMQVLEVNHLYSSYIENKENGQFEIHQLPIEAQYAPIFGMETGDFNGDGHFDLLAIGNNYQTEVISGWYDAHKGLLLYGNGNGQFEVASQHESGLYVEGDGRSLSKLSVGVNNMVLTGMNADRLSVFLNRTPNRQKTISFHPNEVWAEFSFSNGQKQKIEQYLGQGYLSQSSKSWPVPANVRSVKLYGHQMQIREITLDE